jgi:Zn-dependent peptidase ImmA (M78 family)/DNA-binding XRE family transcriptional regulator
MERGMPQYVRAMVEPELLVWARKSAGLEIAEAAKKVQVAEERLFSWESGTKSPTLKQLRKLGAVYKRPLAVFYLPEPPRDFKPMQDFRRLPGGAQPEYSPELRYEIRRAYDRRELAIEMWEATEGKPPEFPLAASLDENPEVVGTRIRECLCITYENQASWPGAYKSFNGWRNAIEYLGVLVFQATDVDLSEMRGFSIVQQPLPAVTANIKDSPRARTFTLLHELAHIMLHRGGLCDLEEKANPNSEDERMEVFCNMVAGATLVPAADLLQEQLVVAKGRNPVWSDDEIQALSRRYGGASREVILRRLLIFGRTTEAFYRAKKEAPGFAPPDVVALGRAGRLFAQLVLSNYYLDRVTASDVSDFLEIRLKHLPKIEAELQAHLS